MRVRGIENVNRRLIAAQKKAEQLSLGGMINYAIAVRRSMEQQSPKTPVDTSNLRHSFFITTTRGVITEGSFNGDDAGKLAADHATTTGQASGMVTAKTSPTLIMGFSANYAAAVHEGKGKGGKKMEYKRPGAGAKFFETALNNNKGLLVPEIGKELKKL